MAIPASAQTDPVLAGLVVDFTAKARSSLKSQQQAMALISVGHTWTREEVQATADIQRVYNDYLDRFNSILFYSAQVYGFYHEIGNLMENFSNLSGQLKKTPTNSLAVALTPRRNKIYREVMTGAADIVNDIRKVCLADIKMTEKDRIDMVFGIRPKLKLMNRKISALVRAVRYTSLGDVWAEIDNNSRVQADKNAITDRAFRRWRQTSKTVSAPLHLTKPDHYLIDTVGLKPIIILPDKRPIRL